jgi:long-chain acyl-CoA synthetase
MREYYRNPEATKAAIDEEGFYHSADVGLLLPDGNFKIIDRKSNIFKLPNGEYVSPETCENKLIRAPLVAQCYVHGDAMHARLVAIVVIDPDTAIPYAKAHNLPLTITELCANKTFQQVVQKEIEVTGKHEGLRGFEIPFKIYLEPEPFTDKNVLTATLKLQRTLAFAKYGEILKDLLGTES